MNLVLLSREPNNYSTKRIREEAERKGHQLLVVDPLKCYMNITSDKPSIHYMGEELPPVDAVIPRIGASVTFYGCAILRQFEMMGTYVLNSSMAISRSRDKLRALQLLSRKGVGLPVTAFAHSPRHVSDLIKTVGGAPLVIKLLEGTQGIGVVLAETKKAAESVIEAFYGLDANILIQEYIKEAAGEDIRCLVLDGKVIGAMKRKAEPGEFRSNLHRGGSAKSVRLSRQERETAIKAAKAMGLTFAGVDILQSSRGPLVMEVNSSPGLRGVEEMTQKNIAGLMLDHLTRKAKPISKLSRYEA